MLPVTSGLAAVCPMQASKAAAAGHRHKQHLLAFSAPWKINMPSAASNAWITHVKAVQASQQLTYKNALKAASITYQRSSAYRSSRKRARERDRIENATAGQINEYATWLKDQLTNPMIARRHKLKEEEVAPLVATVSSCARNILVRFLRQENRDHATQGDVAAACTLARKTILGYDADILVSKEGEGRYDKWIVDHLHKNNWQACEPVQRQVGELPTVEIVRVE